MDKSAGDKKGGDSSKNSAGMNEQAMLDAASLFGEFLYKLFQFSNAIFRLIYINVKFNWVQFVARLKLLNFAFYYSIEFAQ